MLIIVQPKENDMSERRKYTVVVFSSMGSHESRDLIYINLAVHTETVQVFNNRKRQLAEFWF